MSIRLICPSCSAAFLTSNDQLGRQVECPKCGAGQVVPSTVEIVDSPGPATNVWIPNDKSWESADGRRPSRRWLLTTVLAGLLVLGLGMVIAWPWLRDHLRPTPKDPTEVVATAYLKALAEGNTEAAQRLGTIPEPPAIRSFSEVRRDTESDQSVRGSFAPIAALHTWIDSEYIFDEKLDRYQPRNALGLAAETLDALHSAKDKADQSKLAEKIQSGNPDDLFDAAESLGQVFTQLAAGALKPAKLLPKYAQLVEQAKPPLPAAEEALALDYAGSRATWDAMLKRPFRTLKADGPFRLERVEVVARVRDPLASLGDPPTALRLTLTRFRLEGIDTGWKVTSARREGQAASPPSTRTPSAGPESSSPRSVESPSLSR